MIESLGDPTWATTRLCCGSRCDPMRATRSGHAMTHRGFGDPWVSLILSIF
jgi:hypothetical protein